MYLFEAVIKSIVDGGFGIGKPACLFEKIGTKQIYE